MMLNAKSFGIAAGLVAAVLMFFLTILCMYNGYGKNLFEFFENIYPGYSISWQGSFIGALHAFIDGFLFFFLTAWLYNFFEQRKCKNISKK